LPGLSRRAAATALDSCAAAVAGWPCDLHPRVFYDMALSRTIDVSPLRRGFRSASYCQISRDLFSVQLQVEPASDGHWFNSICLQRKPGCLSPAESNRVYSLSFLSESVLTIQHGNVRTGSFASVNPTFSLILFQRKFWRWLDQTVCRNTA